MCPYPSRVRKTRTTQARMEMGFLRKVVAASCRFHISTTNEKQPIPPITEPAWRRVGRPFEREPSCADAPRRSWSRRLRAAIALRAFGRRGLSSNASVSRASRSAEHIRPEALADGWPSTSRRGRAAFTAGERRDCVAWGSAGLRERETTCSTTEAPPERGEACPGIRTRSALNRVRSDAHARRLPNETAWRP